MIELPHWSLLVKECMEEAKREHITKLNMNRDSQALKLYKDLERQWFEKIKEVNDDFEHPDIKELDDRMKIVWNLMTKEERSLFILESQKQLANAFTQSFDKLFPKTSQNVDISKTDDKDLDEIIKELEELNEEDNI